LGDYMTKPVVGTKFIYFRNQVMGITPPDTRGQQECVGEQMSRRVEEQTSSTRCMFNHEQIFT
jgi:hypothetical protein